MKKVKWILGILVFTVSLLLSGEVYQNYLNVFRNQFYHFEVQYTPEYAPYLSAELSRLSDTYHVPVFAACGGITAQDQFHCTVYATDSAKQALSGEYAVHDGTSTSFFSGQSIIRIRPISEMEQEQEPLLFYVMGSTRDANYLMDCLGEHFQVIGGQKGIQDTNWWIVAVIWGIACVLLLLLTWFDIQFQKKRNFVLISLGASRSRLILRNLLLDLGVFLGELGLTVLLLHRYTAENYQRPIVMGILVGFFVCNSLLYLDLLRYNYKEVLYGADRNESLLANCYVLKALTLIAAIASLAVNVTTAITFGKYLIQYGRLEAMSQYSVLNTVPDVSSAHGIDEEETLFMQINNAFFLEQYCQGNVALACSDRLVDLEDGREVPAILYNENGNGLMPEGLEEQINGKSADFYILAPAQIAEDPAVQSAALAEISLTFGIPEEQISFRQISYTGRQSGICLNFSSSISNTYGFEAIQQPICVYCAITPERLRQLSIPKSMSSDAIMKSALYRWDASGQSDPSMRRVDAISVPDRFALYKASLSRVFWMNTCISGFLLLLEMCFIATIVQLEYMVHAKRLALKKIFGYSVWQKNRGILLLNLFATMIGIVTNLLLYLMYGFASCVSILLVSAGLLGLEFCMILYQILRFERVNLAKILKGGSL